ncbi:MAG: hypothetical protein Satyrvirus2_3 [Satyrvirus sp.]|uniref:Uncharacterized protein n=1 Tax=Satyrvirus sp. TaxID=2487771 RepID=A0A3G5ACV6_9VIRU|nr:MAG: hypothetical protein Satyrvirus2_3 [Satyrvirus sp.]
MYNKKKFNIINTIEDDAPHGDINWYTISFLTPQKINSMANLDVKGFKIHNGYNTMELAMNDAKKIKENNNSHDVYLAQMGKIYAWDDATRSDVVEYDNDKLNNLEKTRRENIDKVKLMGEQFKNEYKNIYADSNKERLDIQRKRIQKKLYDKGLITQKEYELMQEFDQPLNEISKIAADLDKMEKEMDECFKTDHLDENLPVGLKYGCITILIPREIGGLKTLCFKVRGLYETTTELNKRIGKIKSLNPNDKFRIYQFEIGKWCGFSEKDDSDFAIISKRLNYAMKNYIENVSHEREEFEKRTKSLQEKTKQESKMTQINNRREKRKAKKKASAISEPSLSVPSASINPEDDDAIEKIINYLDDPDLRNRYPIDRSMTESVKIDMASR